MADEAFDYEDVTVYTLEGEDERLLKLQMNAHSFGRTKRDGP